ncbi:arginyl-tRNA synthetase [Gigaspora margarita]|uniref:Arginyl-tRNA synthetase n=1 Tax=Gigaspora margarita TaxID=4874 RepID=A0A8H4A377_GIGMA|nr:arginyl-tRNA synthetase [Gigaspora margarita]
MLTQSNKAKGEQQNAEKNRNMTEAVEYAASSPAIIDEITTEESIKNCVGYKADANETSLVVCTWKGCNRYFTKMDKFTNHRSRDHGTTDIATDIWMFGNMNKSEISNNNTTKTSEGVTSPIISKASAQSLVNPSTKTEKTELENSNMPDIPVRMTTVTSFPKPQKPTKEQQEFQNSTDTSSLSNKRPRDPSQTEELKVSNKRRETTQTLPQFPGHNNNEIRQPQRQRRYPIDEEQLIGPDGRIRYQPRGNRSQNASPMYGIPYDTGDPRYYNPMQIHPMSFLPYSDLSQPPPRYDYGDMSYGQFYGGGNRRFLNSPPPPQPPPPQRRSR